ncbi:methyltransferase domain-containing protein [Candidatus Gottesmanbacteria bacterium]|nr:methyltransferase domain-containing protein [Candidatus Gottesmanbacteria bacterium]
MSYVKEIAKIYDYLADRYDYIYQSPVNHGENRVVFDLVEKHMGKSILDIGCGTSLFLEYLNPSKYLGIDVSEKMIALARKRYPERHFIVGDMHNLPLKDETFDTVVSLFSCLNLTLTPKMIADEILRVLKPGGHFIGTVVGLRMKYNILAGPKDHDWRNIPITYYTQKSIKEAFGFEELQILGLNYLGNLFEKHERYVNNEFGLLGRTAPDLARHMIIIGRKSLSTV